MEEKGGVEEKGRIEEKGRAEESRGAEEGGGKRRSRGKLIWITIISFVPLKEICNHVLVSRVIFMRITDYFVVELVRYEVGYITCQLWLALVFLSLK